MRIPRFRQNDPPDERAADELALLWPIDKPEPEEGSEEYERAVAAADRLITQAKTTLKFQQDDEHTTASDDVAEIHEAGPSPGTEPSAPSSLESVISDLSRVVQLDLAALDVVTRGSLEHLSQILKYLGSEPRAEDLNVGDIDLLLSESSVAEAIALFAPPSHQTVPTNPHAHRAAASQELVSAQGLIYALMERVEDDAREQLRTADSFIKAALEALERADSILEGSSTDASSAGSEDREER